jgi:hypothetical protein
MTFIMEKCCVFFAVRTECLSTIYLSFESLICRLFGTVCHCYILMTSPNVGVIPATARSSPCINNLLRTVGDFDGKFQKCTHQLHHVCPSVYKGQEPLSKFPLNFILGRSLNFIDTAWFWLWWDNIGDFTCNRTRVSACAAPNQTSRTWNSWCPQLSRQRDNSPRSCHHRAHTAYEILHKMSEQT